MPTDEEKVDVRVIRIESKEVARSALEVSVEVFNPLPLSQ